jgi:protein-S-isoprenylcysteine O-methyltransferase Ste14
MALSEAEQELLAKLEASLAADDPKLAQRLTHPPVRRLHPKRASLGVLGGLIGIALLVAGLSTQIWLSLIGFVVMLAATIFFLTAWRTPSSEPPAAPSSPSPPRPARPDFMARLEQRWKERQDPS